MKKVTKEEKLLNSLINDIISVGVSNIPRSRWHRPNDKTNRCEEKVNIFIENMSYVGMKRLMSLKLWSSVPLSTWSSSDRLRCLSYISYKISFYMMSLKKGRLTAVSNSDGSIGCFVFDLSNEKEKRKIAKRLALKTRDPRMKKRIAPYVGIKRLNKMYVKEKNKNVIYAMEKIYSAIGVTPPNSKNVRAVDRLYNMPLTEIDFQSTMTWNLIRDIKKLDLTEKDVSMCLDKISEIYKKFDLDSPDIDQWHKRTVSCLVMSIIPFMSKLDALSNLDIPQEVSKLKQDYYGQGHMEVSDGFQRVINSKWA